MDDLRRPEPDDPDEWRRVLADADDAPALYAPIVAPLPPDASFALGRIAQSLDGRIACPGGDSFWISGPEDIRHTHRLRALCDAVVVGAGTVRADDPRLTTRACLGASPVRVVVDPRCSLGPTHRVFGDGPPTLLACAADAPGPSRHENAEVLRLPFAPEGDWLDPRALVAMLRARGLRRILVEGGGRTLSHCLAAGVLDRLHVTVAPLLLGDGVPAFTLPAPASPRDGRHLCWTVHHLGRDILLDIPLARA